MLGAHLLVELASRGPPLIAITFSTGLSPEHRLRIYRMQSGQRRTSPPVLQLSSQVMVDLEQVGSFWFRFHDFYLLEVAVASSSNNGVLVPGASQRLLFR